jgi:hypothetical protein
MFTMPLNPITKLFVPFVTLVPMTIAVVFVELMFSMPLMAAVLTPAPKAVLPIIKLAALTGPVVLSVLVPVVIEPMVMLPLALSLPATVAVLFPRLPENSSQLTRQAGR